MLCYQCQYFKDAPDSSYWTCSCKEKGIVKGNKCDKFTINNFEDLEIKYNEACYLKENKDGYSVQIFK